MEYSSKWNTHQKWNTHIKMEFIKMEHSSNMELIKKEHSSKMEHSYQNGIHQNGTLIKHGTH